LPDIIAPFSFTYGLNACRYEWFFASQCMEIACVALPQAILSRARPGPSQR